MSITSVARKADLTEKELAIFSSEFEKSKKQPWLAWVLWLFATTLGAHRFYLGNTGRAICMILFGWCTLFIWNLVDAFFINGRLKQLNEQIEEEILTRIYATRK